MYSLQNKHVILGVTGSIAAYKAAELVRRLREVGAEVQVVMTRGAGEFVTPMMFQALSGHPVHQHLLDAEAEAAMGHIELARWADVIVVAPVSADFMARLAMGRADDLLSAVCLASDVPLALAPAMNMHMWRNPSTQDNVSTLQNRGILFLGPDEGQQACGDVGRGRMLEPEEIRTQLAELFEHGSLSGKTVLITAGPTREAIDPVRFLSNHSSGKMGYSIAKAAVEAGARVILVSGPVSLACPERVQRIEAISAKEMLEAVQQNISGVDIFIATAAVADYRPSRVYSDKLKKDAETMQLELEKTPDIVSTIKAQNPGLYTVGFAAETTDLEKHAKNKLATKKLDMVVANLVGPAAADTQGTFGSDLNSLHLYRADGETSLPLAAKSKLARQLIHEIAQHYEERQLTGLSSNNNVVALNKNPKSKP